MLEAEGLSPGMEQVPVGRPEQKQHPLWNLYVPEAEVEAAQAAPAGGLGRTSSARPGRGRRRSAACGAWTSTPGARSSARPAATGSRRPAAPPSARTAASRSGAPADAAPDEAEH